MKTGKLDRAGAAVGVGAGVCWRAGWRGRISPRAAAGAGLVAGSAVVDLVVLGAASVVVVGATAVAEALAISARSGAGGFGKTFRAGIGVGAAVGGGVALDVWFGMADEPIGAAVPCGVVGVGAAGAMGAGEFSASGFVGGVGFVGVGTRLSARGAGGVATVEAAGHGVVAISARELGTGFCSAGLVGAALGAGALSVGGVGRRFSETREGGAVSVALVGLDGTATTGSVAADGMGVVAAEGIALGRGVWVAGNPRARSVDAAADTGVTAISARCIGVSVSGSRVGGAGVGGVPRAVEGWPGVVSIARVSGSETAAEGLVAAGESVDVAAVEWVPPAAAGADGVSVCSVFAVAGNSSAGLVGVKSGAGEDAISVRGIGKRISASRGCGAGVSGGGG